MRVFLVSLFIFGYFVNFNSIAISFPHENDDGRPEVAFCKKLIVKLSAYKGFLYQRNTISIYFNRQLRKLTTTEIETLKNNCEKKDFRPILTTDDIYLLTQEAKESPLKLYSFFDFEFPEFFFCLEVEERFQVILREYERSKEHIRENNFEIENCDRNTRNALLRFHKNIVISNNERDGLKKSVSMFFLLHLFAEKLRNEKADTSKHLIMTSHLF